MATPPDKKEKPEPLPKKAEITIDESGAKLVGTSEDKDVASAQAAMLHQRIRINKQCYLIDKMQALAIGRRKENFNYLTPFIGTPSLLREKLNSRKGLADFLDLGPHQLAAMVPVVKIFLVPTEAGELNLEGAKEVAFQGFADPNRVESIFAERAGTPRTVALTEFSYELSDDGNKGDGTGKGDMREFHLKFTGDSLDSFLHQEKGKVPVGRLLFPASEKIGEGDTSNPLHSSVRASFAWAVPSVSKDLFSAAQLETIAKSAQHIVLRTTNKIPSITASESGKIDVELTYFGKIELDPLGDFDVFNGPSARARKGKAKASSKEKALKLADKHKKDYQNAMKRLEEEMTEEGIKKVFKSESEDVVNGVDWEALKELRDDIDDDDFKIEGKGSKGIAKAKKLIDALSKQRGRKAADVKAEVEAFKAKMEKYQRTLNNLVRKGQVHTISVPKSAIGIVTDAGGTTTIEQVKKRRLTLNASTLSHNKRRYQIIANNDKVTEANKKLFPKMKVGDEFDTTMKEQAEEALEEIEKQQKQSEAITELQQKQKAEGSGSKPTTSTTNTAVKAKLKKQLNDLAKAKAIEDTKKREAATKQVLSGHKGSTHVPLSAANVEIHYTYVGSLLDQIIEESGAPNNKNAGNATTPRLLLGVFEYPDPRQPSRNATIPLADIPIAIDTYRAWMMKYIIGRGLTELRLNKYIELLVKNLLAEIFDGGELGCLQGGAEASATEVKFMGFEALKGRGGKDRIKTTRFGDEEKIPIEQGLKIDEPRAPKYYVIVYSSQGPAQSQKTSGNKAADELKGLYWVGVRSTKGPVLSLQWEPQEELEAEPLMAPPSHALRFGTDGLAFQPYTAKIRMIGNNLFNQMSTFYIDTSTAGSRAEGEAFAAYGFGGTYTVLKITGKIDRAGWTQEMEGFPTHALDRKDARKKYLKALGIVGEGG